MLLSCQLCREGYEVTAIEPIGEGFSGFRSLQDVVLNYAGLHGFAPHIRHMNVEAFHEPDCYMLAYSINVMEHVSSVEVALENVMAAMQLHGRYRFTCPNYLFPYEPHFNIPTLFSKQLTARIFGRSILNNVRMDDPAGVWHSLNWITVPQIRNVCHKRTDIKLVFRRRLLADSLARIERDTEFARRRSPWLRKLAGGLVRTGLHRVFALIPAAMQPIIDCELTRQGG
jgi:hypothetical protein